MAGNFTINVVVSGAGQGGTGGGGSGNSAITSAVAGAAIVSGLGKSSQTKPWEQQVEGWAFGGPSMITLPGQSAIERGLKKLGSKMSYEQAMWGETNFGYSDGSFTKETFSMGQVRAQSLFRRPVYRAGLLSEQYDPYGNPEDVSFISKDIPYGMSGITEGAVKHFQANGKRYASLAAAAGYKAVQSAVNITEHQSGDKYFNQQINNAAKLAGYASAVAFSGPLAPFVAAGIAINETANAITGAINYNFDRKLERQEISNTLALAGNASYGRNRGVGI